MNKKRYPYLFSIFMVFIIGFTLIVSAPVSGDDSDPKPLTIVRGQDFPPYHFSTPAGELKGFVIETIQETAALMNVKIQFKQYPWSRCLKMVESGEADAMMNLFKTRERETFMHFHDNIIAHETNTFFTISGIEYDGKLETVSAYKLGTIRNYSYGKVFDTFIFTKTYQLETEKELINSLVNNRGDIIIGNTITITALLDQMNLTDMIKPLKPDVSQAPLYIGFSTLRGHEKLSARFTEKLKQLKQSQKYRTIINTYLPGEKK